MGVRATNVAVKNNEYYLFWMGVCSLSYTSCDAYAPYCHLWPVQL